MLEDLNLNLYGRCLRLNAVTAEHAHWPHYCDISGHSMQTSYRWSLFVSQPNNTVEVADQLLFGLSKITLQTNPLDDCPLNLASNESGIFVYLTS